MLQKGGGDHSTLVTGSVLKPDVQPENMPNPKCGGFTENRYVNGLYKFWDAVRQAYPHLVIDMCAGGGTRVDLESAARTVFLWRNDADNGGICDDEARQQADTLGFSQFAPVNSGTIHSCTVNDEGTALNPYLWRGVSMTGGGIGSTRELWEWILADQARVKQMQQAVEERQALRHYAIDGDYWIHSPTLGGAPADLSAVDAWAVWQLHRPEGDGIVTLLRRPNASDTFTMDLRGPLYHASYEVSWAHSFVAEKHQVLPAAQLRRLAVSLPPAASVVIRYTPVSSPSPSPPPPAPAPPPPAPPSPPSPAAAIVFGDAALNFSFDPSTLNIINITAAHLKRAQGFLYETAPHSLWQLNATNCSEFLPLGQQIDSTSPCTGRSHQVVDGSDSGIASRTLVLEWKGVRGLSANVTADVTINISMAPSIPGRASFAASVVTHSQGDHSESICIQCMALPNLPSLVLRSTDDRMFEPEFFGTVTGVGDGYEMPSDNLNVGGVGDDQRPALAPNGGVATMQWTALYTNHSASGTGPPIGLYLATHDPNGELQLMLRHGRYPNATDPGEPLGIRWLHLSEDLAGAAAFVLPYPVIVQAFVGDWFDAAQIYREFALKKATWTRAGSLASRAGKGGPHGIVDWMIATPFWAEGGGTGSGGVASFCSTLQNALEVRDMGYFWNWWMDTTPQTPGGEAYLTPNYTAASPAGFTAAAAQMKLRGVHAFPYLEGRIMDLKLPDWKAEHAEDYACGVSPGQIQMEFYGKLFGVMDPATPYWQEKMARAMSKITDLAPGVDGLYIDQVTGACALACRGAKSGHKAGGGTSWVDGGRKMFARGKAAIGADRAVISESNSEVYMSAVDGYLTLQGWNNCGAVPAWQAVYGGYSLNIGASYQSVMTLPAPYFFSPDFPALLATQFVWGSVMGGDSLNEWEASLYFSNSSNEATRSYTATLASKRLEWSEYLVHGRLMRSPKILNSSLPLARLARPVADAAHPSVMTACMIEQPAVQLWEANASATATGGRPLAVTVVNFARTPVTFSLEVDVTSLLGTAIGTSPGALFWGLTSGSGSETMVQTVRIRTRDEEDKLIERVVEGGVLTLERTLPALTPLLIEVSSASP